MFYVYILKSLKDKKFYIGSTSDIEKRLNCHNRGSNLSTKYRCPFVLHYLEKFNNKTDALKKEKYYKSLKNHRYLEKIISGRAPR